MIIMSCSRGSAPGGSASGVQVYYLCIARGVLVLCMWCGNILHAPILVGFSVFFSSSPSALCLYPNFYSVIHGTPFIVIYLYVYLLSVSFAVPFWLCHSSTKLSHSPVTTAVAHRTPCHPPHHRVPTKCHIPAAPLTLSLTSPLLRQVTSWGCHSLRFGGTQNSWLAFCCRSSRCSMATGSQRCL